MDEGTSHFDVARTLAHKVVIAADDAADQSIALLDTALVVEPFPDQLTPRPFRNLREGFLFHGLQRRRFLDAGAVSGGIALREAELSIRLLRRRLGASEVARLFIRGFSALFF